MSKTKRIFLLAFYSLIFLVALNRIDSLIFRTQFYGKFDLTRFNYIFSWSLSCAYCIISAIIHIVALFKGIKARELLKKWGETIRQKQAARKAKAKNNKKLRLEAKLNKMKEDE